MAVKLIAVLLTFMAVLSFATATPFEVTDQANDFVDPCTCRTSAVGHFCGLRSNAADLGTRYLKGDCIPQNVYRCSGAPDVPARVLVNCGQCVIKPCK